MLLVGLALLCAAFGRQLAPYDPLLYDPRHVLGSPSAQHLLGTDPLGRDVFSQIIGGARISIVVGLLSVAAGMVTGTAIGLVAGLAPGREAGILMRAMDALLVFPSLVLALTITAFLGANLWNVIGALAVTFIPTFAILVRGEVLALSARDFVTGAQALGAARGRVMWRHLLPNLSDVLLVQASFGIGTAILTEASLSFLGLGVPPPALSWGRMLSESLGKWSFWLMVIGFNMTFLIQHVLGVLGMPRRIYTYPDLPHWGWMNMLSTIGVFFMGASALILVWNLATSFFRGKIAGDNPWEAWTLEWATTSPPPHENFVALPPIRSRRPLWDIANPDRPDPIVGENSAVVTLPNHNKIGILSFILSEAGFFATLILAYLYFYAHPQSGPNAKGLDVPRTLVFSVCLFASSFTFWRSEVGLTKQRRGSMLGWLALTILLGGIFLVGQANEYWKLFQTGVDLSTNMFSTTFFTLTGFHGLHVLMGLIALLIFLWMAWEGDLVSSRFGSAFKSVGYFWHFVDVVWVFVLLTVYILPLLR